MASVSPLYMYELGVTSELYLLPSIGDSGEKIIITHYSLIRSKEFFKYNFCNILSLKLVYIQLTIPKIETINLDFTREKVAS